MTRAFHLPVLARMPGVRLDWLCDTSAERASALAREFGVPAIFSDVRRCPDVDAVLVAIPVGHRHAVYEEILGRRWHMFAEKPLTASAVDHARLVARGREAGVEVCVGLLRRVFAASTLVKRLMARQVFGEVIDLRASEGARLYASQRGSEWYQADPTAAGGGVLIERGSHLIDHTLFMIEAREFTNVRATVNLVDGMDVDVRAAAEITAPAALRVPVAFALSLTEDLPSGVLIRCRHANIRVGVTDDAPVAVEDDDGRILARLEADDRGSRSFYQGFHLEWEAFLSQCHSRAPSVVDAASALLGAEFIDAVYAAAAPAVVTR